MTLSLRGLWQFFASVKLALFTLFILAATSIFGTFIEQKKTPDFYLEEYGEALAELIQVLGLTNMYNSWWFIALLLLFSINLIVCSIERLPAVWRIVAAPLADMTPQQLEKQPCCFSAKSGATLDQVADRVEKILVAQGWRQPRTTRSAGTISLAVQRGAWTRLAVYVVHASVLVVLAGALIGALFGFQGFIFLPEGRSSDRVFYQKDSAPLLLDFQFFCDRAEKSFYPDGMVSEYRADMRIIDEERGVNLSKSVIVNDPLVYRGVSFYVGDFLPSDEYLVVISHPATQTEQAFRVGAEMDFAWPEAGVTARLEEFNRGADNEVLLARLTLRADGQEEPSEVWVRNNNSAVIDHAGQEYRASLHQYTSVLLLVNKDPGVWLVWAGFLLLSVGIYICFFTSHRRLWVCLSATAKGTRVVIGGTSNKNKPGFEKAFNALTEEIGRAL